MNEIIQKKCNIKQSIISDLLNLEHRIFFLLPWVITVTLFLIIILKIISYGYIPVDDAMRHVGKAISGKPWSEILVLRQDAPMDHNPGWHFILRSLYLQTGWDADELMVFSIVLFCMLYLIAPLFWMRRPEAWLMSLLIFSLINMTSFVRMTHGRPYILGISITISVISMWYFQKPALKPRIVLTVILFVLSTWIHGSWYLYVMIPFVFLISGEFKKAAQISLAWIVGSFIGACFTGEPIKFLSDEVRIAFMCFGNHELTRMLVTEFQPSTGDITIWFAVLIILIIRKTLLGDWPKMWSNPFFLLAVVTWILGLKICRFWIDWGLPSLVVWTAFQIQEILEVKIPEAVFKRFVFNCALSAALFLGLTSDLGNRWTYNLTIEYITPDAEGIQGWLPEDGGIIYSASMQTFYRTFFKNPNANWKYILGFECTFMPPDDLKIYRKIQWNLGDSKSYEPWVKKMRPQDRLVIYGDASSKPNIKELEWHYAVSGTWIGRLPRTNP